MPHSVPDSVPETMPDSRPEVSPYARVEPQNRRRGGIADAVARYVRDLILTGALKPGSKVDQTAADTTTPAEPAEPTNTPSSQ
ncbi:MAG: hypothetical protein OXB92_09895 [Acidimicrobiaceae bacterium]|nr:hypothetical protein [Acidimicrobiia bacterium]MCY4494154.1 hypothetical protein [Acidimicrobiaceae bacterium]